MKISVEDTSYRCKNCDSFSQCEYYHHRRPDSHICKEFRNDWRQRDVLDKISAEIEHEKGKWDYLTSDTCFDIAIGVVKRYEKEAEGKEVDG